jgi:hypothetical protein
MATIIKICAKCSDLSGANLVLVVDGKLVGKEYSGYVPAFFPGEHYGDYIMLDIDVDTGKIVNWKVPRAEALAEIFLYGGEG